MLRWVQNHTKLPYFDHGCVTPTQTPLVPGQDWKLWVYEKVGPWDEFSPLSAQGVRWEGSSQCGQRPESARPGFQPACPSLALADEFQYTLHNPPHYFLKKAQMLGVPWCCLPTWPPKILLQWLVFLKDVSRICDLRWAVPPDYDFRKESD